MAIVLPLALGACGSSPAGQGKNAAVTGATAATVPAKGGSGGKVPEKGPQPGFEKLVFSAPTKVDNKWFPLKPGTQFIYEGQTVQGAEEIEHRVVLTVTDLTKVIAGVRNVVVWDRDYSDGVLAEEELAFFAQADDGNVWHFGQYPEVYEAGKIVDAPAWIHGVKGARAGLTIRATPKPGGPSYSQGWGPEVGWSDRAKVKQTGQRVCVLSGCYQDVLVMDEFSEDEPGAHQLKSYAAGVGNIGVAWAGNDPTKETLQLVKVVRLDPVAMSKVRQAALKLEQSAYKVRKQVYGATTPIEP